MLAASRAAATLLIREAGPSLAAEASVATTSRLPHTVVAPAPTRPLSTSARWCAPPRGGRSSQPRREYRDEAIRARLVRLVDPNTGSLMPAVYPMKDLLNTIDRKRFWVVQVKPQTGPKRGGREQQEEDEAEDEQGEDEQGAQPELKLEDMAVVKLVDKKAVYDQQKAAKRAASGASSDAEGSTGSTQTIGAGVSGPGALKELQFSWASMPNDMDHKLTHMKTQHLMRRGPGARLQVVITTPKGAGKVRPGQATTPDAKRAFIESLQSKLCDWIMTSEGEQLPFVDPHAGTDAARPSTKGGYYARPKGDIEWRGGKRLAVAVFEIEVVKAK